MIARPLVLTLSLWLAQLVPLQSAPHPTLADLGFLSGCWEGPFNSRGRAGVIEEHYTAPSQNLILGTTRYLVDERAVQFEFTLIRQDSLGVDLIPYPGGERSDPFRLTSVSDGKAIFENPEHDDPKRIIYRMEGDDGRVARIDAGPDDSDGSEWRMRRVECP